MKVYYEGPERFRPLSPWAYVGYSVLYSIPLLGFVFLIINSFSAKNINLRNYTRAYWCGILLAVSLMASAFFFFQYHPTVSHTEITGMWTEAAAVHG